MADSESETLVSDGGTGAEARIVQDRRDKLDALRAAGIEPYPFRSDVTASIGDVRAAHDALEDGEETTTSYVLAGRMLGRRGQGKASFADLHDRSGRLQLLVTLDRLGD